MLFFRNSLFNKTSKDIIRGFRHIEYGNTHPDIKIFSGGIGMKHIKIEMKHILNLCLV